ncbi:MAG: peptidoglycan DD-metalloendopeptidase family protein [Prevotella sp.]|nr:peptidoglycan DD-metalloendopeptidase family protein [Prevotella sp.]
MRRLKLLLFLLLVLLTVTAQQKRGATQRKATVTKTAARKSAAPQRKKTTTVRQASGKQRNSVKDTKQQRVREAGDKAAKQAAKDAVNKAEVKDMQNERQKVRTKIKEQEQRLLNNERDVKKRLQNLMVIDNEIADKEKTIDTIRRDITSLDGKIALLNQQLDTLGKQLEQRRQRYMSSMRYMHRNRSIESKLLFIFSAHNFTQMYRRQRFVREYAAYQRAQGEAVKSKQQEVEAKQQELVDNKRQKDALLARGVREHQQLETKQEEQKNMVSSLQREQKTIQGIIAQERKKDAALNAQIDRLIAIEVENARKRAEEEMRQQVAAEEAKRRAEELARKKAAAEAAAREDARRIAAAKAKEERLKQQAREAARKNAQEKAAAERAAKAAELERKDVERRAAADAKAREREITETKRSSTEVYTVSKEDRRISGSFERNKGRLPIPITGPYRIVTRFGQYSPTGTKVTLDSKGISLQGQGDANVRSIFDGEVSYVANIGGQTVVLVRHGSYISVYCNLSSVSVKKGDRVSTRQSIGRLSAGSILQFQLRRETAKLNPEAWLGR